MEDIYRFSAIFQIYCTQTYPVAIKNQLEKNVQMESQFHKQSEVISFCLSLSGKTSVENCPQIVKDYRFITTKCQNVILKFL